ncbi:unnamed protein product [Lota lota]
MGRSFLSFRIDFSREVRHEAEREKHWGSECRRSAPADVLCMTSATAGERHSSVSTLLHVIEGNSGVNSRWDFWGNFKLHLRDLMQSAHDEAGLGIREIASHTYP